MPKVTTPMISASTSAIGNGSSAIVNPTDSASIEVATPMTMSDQKLIGGRSSASEPPFMPSQSILPPMKSSSISAIQGMNFWKEVKVSAIVCMHSQPISGIAI